MTVNDDDTPACPKCSHVLTLRDHKKRIFRRPGGRKDHIIVPRYRCEKCDELHVGLPNCLTPFKHYGTETIESVLDEKLTPEDLETEDYPSVQTMERWKKWIDKNILHIDGVIKSTGYRLLDLGEEFLKYTGSLLTEVRITISPGWLKAILRIIYNSGSCLEPYREGEKPE